MLLSKRRFILPEEKAQYHHRRSQAVSNLRIEEGQRLRVQSPLHCLRWDLRRPGYRLPAESVIGEEHLQIAGELLLPTFTDAEIEPADPGLRPIALGGIPGRPSGSPDRSCSSCSAVRRKCRASTSSGKP